MAQAAANNKVKAFFKILTEDLEFEDATQISSAKIQRLFDNPATGPFLTEFVRDISKENILTNEQLEEYGEIEAQGRTKTGDDLLKTISFNEKRNAGYEEQKTDLDKKIQKAKLKKKRLEYQLQKNEEMKKQQQQEYEKTKEFTSESSLEVREQKNQVSEDNEQIGKTMSDLKTTYDNLCSIFENVEENYLLSQTDLKSLIQAEEQYNVQLTSFVKKQFFEISKSIAKDLNEDDTTHKVVQLNDRSLFSGEGEVFKEKIAAELKRVEYGYPDREKSMISAESRESAAESTLSFLRQKKSNIQQNTFEASADELRLSYERNMLKSTEVNDEIHQLSNVKIPQLIAESTPLQTTYLLTGDYRRKIVRQEYFIERQNKVITLLQQQQARLDLLWKLLTVEGAGHKKTGEQIPVLLNGIHSMLNESAANSEWLEANAFEKEESKARSVFDEKDEVAISICRLLEGENEEDPNSTLFHHFDNLPNAAETLRKALDSVQKVAISSPNPDELAVNELSDAISRGEDLLMNSKQRDRGDNTEIVLTPEAVTNMTKHLQTEFDRLSELVVKSSKELEKKRSYLEYNKRTAEVRSLWVDFQINPKNVLQRVGESV